MKKGIVVLTLCITLITGITYGVSANPATCGVTNSKAVVTKNQMPQSTIQPQIKNDKRQVVKTRSSSHQINMPAGLAKTHQTAFSSRWAKMKAYFQEKEMKAYSQGKKIKAYIQNKMIEPLKLKWEHVKNASPKNS